MLSGSGSIFAGRVMDFEPYPESAGGLFLKSQTEPESREHSLPRHHLEPLTDLSSSKNEKVRLSFRPLTSEVAAEMGGRRRERCVGSYGGWEPLRDLCVQVREGFVLTNQY